MIVSLLEILAPVSSSSSSGKKGEISLEKQADLLAEKNNSSEQNFLKLLAQMPKNDENAAQSVIHQFGLINCQQCSEKEHHDLFASEIEPENILNDSKNESSDSKNIESHLSFSEPIENDEAGPQNLLSVLEQIMHPHRKKQLLSTDIYPGALSTHNKPAAAIGMVSIAHLINSDSEKNETILGNTKDIHSSNRYTETVFNKDSKQVVNSVLNQSSDHLFKDARQGMQNTTIHLFPPELETIRAEIFPNNDCPTVHMHPQNPGIARILEKHFQSLQKASDPQETPLSASKVSHSPHAALNTGLTISEMKPTDKQLTGKTFTQQAKTDDGLKMVTNLEEKIQKIEEILKSSTINHSDTDNPVKTQPVKNSFYQAQSKLDTHESMINSNAHLKQTDTAVEKNLQRMENNMLNQIAARLFNGVRQNTPNMTIHLYPPELGKVKVKIISKNGSLNVQMQSQNNQVVGILERNLPMLQQSLENQGITLSDLRVDVESDSQDHEKSPFEKEELMFTDENIIHKKPSQDEQGVLLTETNPEVSRSSRGLSLRV